MAKSGSGRIGSSWNSSYGLKFYWSCTQNVEGNYSDFTVDIYASFLLYATISVGSRADSYIEIGGNRETKTFPAVSKMDNPAKDVYLGTKTQRIYHNSEGKLDNVYLYTYWPIKATITNVYRASIEGGINTGAIDTIPRASKLNDVANFNLGNNINITYTKYAGSFIDELYITLGGVNIGYRGNIPSNYNLVLTQDEINLIYSKIPSTNTAALTFTIFTYSGSTQIGSSTKNATASVVNSNPTFSNFDYLDANSSVSNITGNNQVIIKNKSTLRVVINNQNKMVARNYATAKNYIITCDDKTITVNYSETSITADLGVITNAGMKRLSIKAVDSRGNSTTIYKDISIVEYVSPTSNTEITRLNNFENQTTITMNGSFNLLTLNGINKNTIEIIKYRYSEVGSAYPSTWTNMTYQISNNLFTVTNIILNLDNAKAFNFQFEIIDRFEAIYITKIVDIGKELMFLNADTGDLEIMGEFYSKGKKIGGLGTAENNGSNANNINETSIYMMTGGTSANMPTNNWMYLFTIKDIRVNTNTTQLSFDDVSNRMYIRNRNGSGNWSQWKQLAMISYGTGNPGSLMDGEIYIKY